MVNAIGPDSGQSFALHRIGGGRPATGRYPIGRWRDGSPPRNEFQIIYALHPQFVDFFVSDGGGLEITESTDRRVAGRFQATAVRYCRQSPSGTELEGSCSPVSVPSDAPRVQINGAFVAHRAVVEPGPTKQP